MQPSYDLWFVSTNKNKYREAKDILSKFNIKLGFLFEDLKEIQSNSIEKIARNKAENAFKKCKTPILVEDSGLFIDALEGFPGPYSSFALTTIGNEGILKLVGKNRNAKFVSIVVYYDKKNGMRLFKGIVKGAIAIKPLGRLWGFDPIFIPEGKNQTFAMIPQKNTISHRNKSLTNFAKWFRRMQK